MSSPYGKGEKKGPSLTLAELMGAGPANAPLRPPCEVCQNGRLDREDLPGWPKRCPGCKRRLDERA